MSVITGLINGIQPSLPGGEHAADDHQGLQPDVRYCRVGRRWADLQHRQHPGRGAGAERSWAFTDLLPSSLQLANGTVGGTCGGYTVTDVANVALAAGSTIGEGDRAVDCGERELHDHGQRDQQAGPDEHELYADGWMRSPTTGR
jgi:hypothetical protein